MSAAFLKGYQRERKHPLVLFTAFGDKGSPPADASAILRRPKSQPIKAAFTMTAPLQRRQEGGRRWPQNV